MYISIANVHSNTLFHNICILCNNKVSFDTIVTTTTDWTKVGNEKLRPMVHSFYMPVSAKKGEYKVTVSAYKDGHKVTINVPVKVDGAILNEIRTRIRDN